MKQISEGNLKASENVKNGKKGLIKITNLIECFDFMLSLIIISSAHHHEH